ncbi:MAG: tetratricopeptide repeat protein [Bacillota bacterium]
MNSRRFISTFIIMAAVIAVFAAGCGGTQARAKKELELAVKYLSEGKFEEAVLAYNEVIKIDPKNVAGYKGLARTLVLQDKFDEAEAVYQKGLDLVRDKDQLKLCLASLYIDQGRIGRAEETYRELIQTDPHYLPAYEGLAKLLFSEGNFEEAISLLKEGISENPYDPRGFSLLAEMYMRTGAQDDALNAAIKSLAVSLDQRAAYEIVKEIFNNDWYEIIAYGSDIADEYEAVGSMLRIYGYYNSGQYDRAIMEYEALAGKGIRDNEPKIYAALSYLEKNNHKDADALINQVNLGKSKNPDLYADVARYHLIKEDLEEAEKIALRGLQLDEASKVIYLIMYQIAQKRNDPRLEYLPYLILVSSTDPVREVEEELNEEGIQVTFPTAGGSSGGVTEGVSGVSARESSGQSIGSGTILTTTVIVCDVSDSMNEYQEDEGESKLESAKTAAIQMLQLIGEENKEFGPKHEVGLVTFSSSAALLLSSTTEISNAERVVEGISAGESTNIGDALQLANAELQKSRAKKKIIVMLSDGETNTGLSPEEIVDGPVNAAGQAGYTIFTVGFGDPGSLDEDLLRKIAESTGGRYSYAEGSYELQNIYIRVRHEATGMILTEKRGEIRQNETKEIGKVEVSRNVGQLHSTLNWGGSALDLILKDPSGRIVDENYRGATISKKKPFYIIVENPRRGTWTALAYGKEVPEETLVYDFVASGRERGKRAFPYAPLIILGIVLVVCLVLAVILKRGAKGSCSGCGTLLEPDTLFCPQCGRRKG